MLKHLLTAALLSLSGMALAHDYTVGKLHIEHPWSLALPGNSVNGAAYFIVQNHGQQDDRLLSASSPRAARVEIHEHREVQGVLKMQKVESLSIPAGGKVVFAPGHYHLMLFGLHKPLADGEAFPVTLNFEKNGSQEVEVRVKKDLPEAQEMPHSEHSMQH